MSLRLRAWWIILEKDVFRLVTSVAQRENSEPHEKSKLRSSDSALRRSIIEPQRLYSERGPLRSSYVQFSNIVWVVKKRLFVRAKGLNGHLLLNIIMWQIKPLNNGSCSFKLIHDFPPREKFKISNKNGITAFNFRKTAMQSRP